MAFLRSWAKGVGLVGRTDGLQIGEASVLGLPLESSREIGNTTEIGDT